MLPALPQCHTHPSHGLGHPKGGAGAGERQSNARAPGARSREEAGSTQVAFGGGPTTAADMRLCGPCLCRATCLMLPTCGSSSFPDPCCPGHRIRVRGALRGFSRPGISHGSASLGQATGTRGLVGSHRRMPRSSQHPTVNIQRPQETRHHTTCSPLPVAASKVLAVRTLGCGCQSSLWHCSFFQGAGGTPSPFPVFEELPASGVQLPTPTPPRPGSPPAWWHPPPLHSSAMSPSGIRFWACNREHMPDTRGDRGPEEESSSARGVGGHLNPGPCF